MVQAEGTVMEAVTPDLTLWENNPEIYPPFEEIVASLQDKGKEKTIKKKKKTVLDYSYPLIEKLATQLHRNIRLKYPDSGLGRNASRDSEMLKMYIVYHRKLQDVSSAPPPFTPYAKPVSDKKDKKTPQVFLITTCTKYAGLEQAVKDFRIFREELGKKKSNDRTPDHALRLALIMLEPELRDGVIEFLAGRKDRTHQDQSHDTDDAFFAQLNKEYFSNKKFIVNEPDPSDYLKFPAGKELWQPNNPSLFEQEYTPVYVKNIWLTYTRKKYRAALDRWNKETGGGDGTPHSFVEYCDKADKWLVWIFLEDMKKGFLLASTASGRMPEHLIMESGVTTHMDQLKTDKKTESKVTKVEAELAALRKGRETIDKALMETLDIFKQNSARSTTVKEEDDEGDRLMAVIKRCSEDMSNEAVLGTMTPDTKTVYIESIKKRRKYNVQKLNEYTVRKGGLFPSPKE